MDNVRKTRQRAASTALSAHGAFKPQEVVAEVVPISSIKEHYQEVRTISRWATAQVCAVFRYKDQLMPILVEDDGNILAGHELVHGAKRLGWTTIKPIMLASDGCTFEELRAERIANRADIDRADTQSASPDL